MHPGLVDPRGGEGGPPLVPAPRLPSLDGRSVLLVDNGKLGESYGPYAVLWEVLARRFPATSWRHFTDDLLDYDDDEVVALADELAARKPEAAILALSDAGVSLPTALLSLELERRGIPTVVYATMLGARFVRGMFANLAPSLEPIALDTKRTDTAERVTSLAEASLPALTRHLTEPRAAAAAASSAGAAPSAGKTDFAAVTDGMLAFQDWAEEVDLGDGLPILPPSQRAVDAVLATVPDDPDEIIFGPTLTSGRTLRVRDAAAAAVMTAAPVRSFPVILAALRAMVHPEYILNFGQMTTHPSGNAVVFSGPDAAAYGLSGGPGCLGPGHRGNASTGRAVALALSNVFRSRPGATDLTAFGSQAEFTYCFAEAVEASPWPSLADEIGGGESGVLVLKVEGPRNVLDHRTRTPEGLIEALAGTATGVGSNNAYIPGDLLAIVNPEHASIFGDAGWTRHDVKEALYQKARIPRALTEGHGVLPRRPAYMEVLDDVPVVRDSSDVHIVVAGSPAPQSMLALPWGSARAQWHPIGNKR